ncbi:aldehyde dehydrogenase family protein [Flexivirga caeni]|uniref:Aldehyde dehydrogenase n=1 Tax=Flexivirga caeni TaxID=2294115 RepID=A0A3M9LWQ9_9MICO|nr:aldehyde dehydrogenase family protein [Flexivirga caeni]RNI17731.1 aldehyde dehydrogenase [Flexivirga caeni]
MTHKITGDLVQADSFFVDGDWKPARADALDVIDPGLGTAFSRIGSAEPAEVDQAVAAARRAFDDGRWTGLSGQDRSLLIWRLADLIETNVEQLAHLESRDVGMPLAQARAMIGEAVKMYRYYAGLADKVYGESIEIGSSALRFQGYTRKEPVGVAALITSWNAPMVGLGMKLPAALAAGCCVVIKPSEEASLSTLALAALATEAGIPGGVVNVVTGVGTTTGDALVKHPEVDLVSFTGSIPVGKQIAQSALGNLKKVTLELGGKSAMIVMPDADLDAAIPALSLAVFWNAGQICTAGTRLLVHRSVAEQVAQGIAEHGRALKIGYGLDDGNDLGPLISQRQLDRVEGYVHSGREDGARVLSGGERLGEQGYYYAPTVLADVTPAMKVVSEEIFGPVLGVMAFDTVDEAVRVANNTEYGLAGSVWSGDAATAHSIARRLRTGKVGINVHRAGGVQMPIGGYKESGWGRECGPEGLQEYLETKSVIQPLIG